MSDLLTDKTQLQSDLDDINDAVLRSAQALNYAAGIITEGNKQYWSIPLDRLLPAMNADVAATIAKLESNSLLAEAINPQLASFDPKYGFSNRIPTERGNPYVVFDMNTMQFVDTTPEPQPEPLPEEL